MNKEDLDFMFFSSPQGVDVLPLNCRAERWMLTENYLEGGTGVFPFVNNRLGDLVDEAGFTYEIMVVPVSPFEMLREGCVHEWGIDGAHSNEYCKKCFASRAVTEAKEIIERC